MLSYLLWQTVYTGCEPNLMARLFLIGHISHTSTIFADNYCCQMGCSVARSGQLAYLIGYFFLNLQGHCLAI